MRPKYRG